MLRLELKVPITGRKEGEWRIVRKEASFVPGLSPFFLGVPSWSTLYAAFKLIFLSWNSKIVT